jgi:hypothetical protein
MGRLHKGRQDGGCARRRGAAVTAGGRCDRARQRRHRELGTSGKYGLLPATFLPGTVVNADSTAGSTGPQLLYAAIGSSNLRAYADTDAVGHAATGN